MKAKFKISQLAAQDTVQKELVHPKHGDTGIMVTIAGPLHPEWKEALKMYEETSGVEGDERASKLFAAAVLGWDEEAMEVPYSKEAALELFKNEKQAWFIQNVVDTVQDHTKFFL